MITNFNEELMNFEVILDYQDKISQEVENGFFKDGLADVS